MRDRSADQNSGQVAIAALGVAVIITGIVTTSASDSSALGAPGYWAWILTGLQVGALRTAATGRRVGWLMGASIQLPWVTYAIVTTQLGFVPGCLVSGVVQAHGYLRGNQFPGPTKQTTYA